MIVVRNVDELYAFLTKSKHIFNISTGIGDTYVHLDTTTDNNICIYVYVTTTIHTVNNEIIERAADYGCIAKSLRSPYQLNLIYKNTYKHIIFTRHMLTTGANWDIILDMRGAIRNEITYIMDFNLNYFKQYMDMRIINIPITRYSVSTSHMPTPDRIMACLLAGKDKLPSNNNPPVSNLKAANHVMPDTCPQCNAYFMKTYEYRKDGRGICCCLCSYSCNITHYRKISYKKILNDTCMKITERHKNGALLMELADLFDRNSNACLNPTYIGTRLIYCNKIAIVEYSTMFDLDGFDREIDTIIVMNSFIR